MSCTSSSARTSLVGRRSVVLGLLLISSRAAAFSGSVFQERATLQRTAPSKTEGVEIELPAFDIFFDRIQAVSPLARLAIQVQAGGTHEGGGFQAIDDTDPEGMQWKKVERNKKRTVYQIDKIDNFQNLGPPLLRFRASLEGPIHGGMFASFMMSTQKRLEWDPQIDQVGEIYPINDLDAANIAMGFGKFGDCRKLGVGYTLTKKHPIGISPREQLTICGVQNFDDGSSLVWGTEMEDWHDGLFDHPQTSSERKTRGRSHLFSVALVPTGENTFDVEYCLQLDFGGSLPHWMTAPLVVDSVKSMFKVIQPYFAAGEGGELDEYLKKEKEEQGSIFSSLLFTP